MMHSVRLLCTVCLGMLLVAPAPAQDAPASDRLVRVSGEGTVRVAPDRATVRFGVVSQAETAEAARRQNATAAESAMNAVRKLGIAETKMRMETLRLRPRREYNPQTQTREKRGYEASRQVVVELDTLAQLPRLVTRVVQRGANRLEGIDYGLQDRTAARNDALRQAAHSARDKAQLLAESLGAALGPVRQIDEQSFGYQDPSPRAEMQFAKSRTDDAAPRPDAYAAGEITVNATVQVTFSLR
ncbi:MAG: SIMPL domain-containing protein [Salinibacter sp.]